MKIHVDVDGTVALQNLPVLFDLYNTYFRLQLMKEQLREVTSLAVFEALPEVQAFRLKKGELSYAYLRESGYRIPTTPVPESLEKDNTNDKK